MHVMIDTETLGQKPGCVVLSLGAKVFNPSPSPNSLKEPGHTLTFYRNIDVFSCLMAGLIIEPGTVDWWKTKSLDAKRALTNPAPISLELAIGQFNSWVRQAGQLLEPQERKLEIWAKSPSFDCAVLDAAGDAIGTLLVWHEDQRRQGFRSFRDVRTIVAATGVLEATAIGTGRVAHNAMDDCEIQIVNVQMAFSRISAAVRGLPSPVPPIAGAPPVMGLPPVSSPPVNDKV